MKMKNAAHSPNMPDFPPKTGMSYTMLDRFVKWVETLSENIYLYARDYPQCSRKKIVMPI